MKPWHWIGIVGLAFAAAASAQQGIAPGTVTGMLNGTCSALMVGGEDRTADCKATAINNAYPNGNGSFMFLMGDEIVSFFGRDTKAVGDQAVIHLTRVSVNNGGMVDQRRSSDVSGTCTYTNPNKGPVRITCEATGAKGRFRAVFTSDGRPPELIEL